MPESSATRARLLGRTDSRSGRIRDFGHHGKLPSGLPVAKPAPPKNPIQTDLQLGSKVV